MNLRLYKLGQVMGGVLDESLEALMDEGQAERLAEVGP